VAAAAERETLAASADSIRASRTFFASLSYSRVFINFQMKNIAVVHCGTMQWNAHHFWIKSRVCGWRKRGKVLLQRGLLRRGTCQSAIIEKPRELVHQIAMGLSSQRTSCVFVVASGFL
jgi:hypothetical protein